MATTTAAASPSTRASARPSPFRRLRCPPALPFGAALFAPVSVIFGVTFVALALTGALSAHLSGVPKTRAVLRIVIGGMLALAVTFAVGSIFGAAI
ncbi:VIT1/CCC1 transporter family protein [Corynebacterium macclintockiae]|uniref:VIT1/CCC1 transporter family protein n=1 Tax=Corynebacterium macclintockiae TaxID=2913501 RepID=UPI003EC11F63